MNRILVPIDFSENAVNTLKYAFELGKKQNIPLSLLHCYSIQEFDRPFNFGELGYDYGIRAKLSEFYVTHTQDEAAEKVRFIARAGVPEDKIIGLSDSYNLIVLSGKPYETQVARWMGSKSTIIATKAKCPVLIVPPTVTYSVWEHIWRIKRYQEDIAIKPSALGTLSISPSNITVKTLDQEDFASTLWQTIVDYIKKEEPALLKSIKTLAVTEQIDLFLLQNDQTKKSLAYYLNIDSLQVIFQFKIPVLIFQSNIIG